MGEIVFMHIRQKKFAGYPGGYCFSTLAWLLKPSVKCQSVKLLIDAVNWVGPSSDKYKRKTDYDLTFPFILDATGHHAGNYVYRPMSLADVDVLAHQKQELHAARRSSQQSHLERCLKLAGLCIKTYFYFQTRTRRTTGRSCHQERSRRARLARNSFFPVSS